MRFCQYYFLKPLCTCHQKPFFFYTIIVPDLKVSYITFAMHSWYLFCLKPLPQFLFLNILLIQVADYYCFLTMAVMLNINEISDFPADWWCSMVNYALRSVQSLPSKRAALTVSTTMCSDCTRWCSLHNNVQRLY